MPPEVRTRRLSRRQILGAGSAAAATAFAAGAIWLKPWRHRPDPEAAELLTRDQAAHLVSIAREAMSNSLRHSGASAGILSLGLSDEGVRLVVEDNGVGFEVSRSPQQGHGLKNMQTRARRFGGRLDVRFEHGHGTTVACTIPIIPMERKHASS